MPFPALKLLSVLARQLSKPLSSFLQRKAVENKIFRYMCEEMAQRYNRAEQRILRSFYSRPDSDSKYIPPLNPEKAVEMGSVLLGETFVFTVAAAILFAEYRRQVLKETLKEEKLADQLRVFRDQISQLQQENDIIMEKLFPEKKFEREAILSIYSEDGLWKTATNWVAGLFNYNKSYEAENDVFCDKKNIETEDRKTSTKIKLDENDCAVSSTIAEDGSVACSKSNDSCNVKN